MLFVDNVMVTKSLGLNVDDLIPKPVTRLFVDNAFEDVKEAVVVFYFVLTTALLAVRVMGIIVMNACMTVVVVMRLKTCVNTVVMNTNMCLVLDLNLMTRPDCTFKKTRK